MCRAQTCLLYSWSEIRDRLAWGRLALAQLWPQTGSGMSLQYSLPLCGFTTLLLRERLNHATDVLCTFPQPLSSQGYSYGCLTFTLGYSLGTLIFQQLPFFLLSSLRRALLWRELRLSHIFLAASFNTSSVQVKLISGGMFNHAELFILKVQAVPSVTFDYLKGQFPKLQNTFSSYL